MTEIVGIASRSAAEILVEVGDIRRSTQASTTRRLIKTCTAHILRRCAEMFEQPPLTNEGSPAKSRAFSSKRSPHAISQPRRSEAKQPSRPTGSRSSSPSRRSASRTAYSPNISAVRPMPVTFLTSPDVEATNWRAEQAIRPAVVNRKGLGREPHRTRRVGLGQARHIPSLPPDNKASTSSASLPTWHDNPRPGSQSRFPENTPHHHHHSANTPTHPGAIQVSVKSSRRSRLMDLALGCLDHVVGHGVLDPVGDDSFDTFDQTGSVGILVEILLP